MVVKVVHELLTACVGPVQRQAEVLGDTNQSVVVNLGSEAVLQCYAFGYPRPFVRWFHGTSMLPTASEELEQRRDHSLVLRIVKIQSLGYYTCQAYNGMGKAASWTLTLKAFGPVHSVDPNDVTYNEFLVTYPRLDYQPIPPALPRVPPTQTAVATAVYGMY